MEQRQPEQRYYSPEEYLAQEEQAEVRHEYYQGEIFAMAGTTLWHNRVVGNGLLALQKRLNPDHYEAFVASALVKVSEAYYFYPDLIVSCHEEDLTANRILQYPSVLVEVLSPGSADYDRTTNFRLYRQLPSLQHYVLIRQDYCWVECLTRVPSPDPATSDWLLRIHDSLTDVLQLPALGVGLPLAELYARVRLTEPPQAPSQE